MMTTTTSLSQSVSQSDIRTDIHSLLKMEHSDGFNDDDDDDDDDASERTFVDVDDILCV